MKRIQRVTLQWTVSCLALVSAASAAEFHMPLFRLKKDNHISYALGTMHVKIATGHLPSYLEALIESRRYFLTEDRPNSPRLRDWAIGQIQNRKLADLRLQNDLGQREWELAKAILKHDMLKNRQVSWAERLWLAWLVKRWGPYSPPGIIFLLLNPYLIRTLDYPGYDPAAPEIDERLINQARSKVRAMVFLDEETLFEPGAILAKMKNQDLQNVLTITLELAEQFHPYFLERIEAFYSGDLERITKLLQHAAVPALQNSQAITREIIARHQQWPDWIDTHHRLGGSLIAVGAAHLLSRSAGPTVLELLEQRGFEIDFIPVEDRCGAVF